MKTLKLILLALCLALPAHAQKAIETDANAKTFWENLADIPTAPLSAETQEDLRGVIDAEEAGTAAAYPIETSPEAIHHFYDQLTDFSTAEYPGDGKFVVIGCGGDSMGTSSGFVPYVALEMIRRYGQGCVASTGFAAGIAFGSGQQTLTDTLGGSATLVSDTYTYLPNGEYYNLPIGGTVTQIAQSANIHAGWTKVRCWYARRSGGGTLTFTVSQYGTPITAKTADTGAGTAGTIGYVDFDAADGLLKNGKPTLVVSNATGVSHYLGTYMYLGSGVVPVTVGRGSSSYAQALTSTAANLATFCAAMDARLIFHAVKEEDTDLSDLDSMMTRWYEQHPNCSHVWVGNTSSPSGDGALDVTTNAAIRAKCATYKWAFVDGQKLLRTVAYMDTIGSTSDGWNESSVAPHLTIPARRFIASWIIDKLLLNLQVPGGRFNLQTDESCAMRVLSDTTTRTTIWAQSSTTYGSSNFAHTTPDFGKMTYTFSASPAPVANSGRAGKIADFGPQMGFRQIMKYRLFDGHLLDDIRAVVLCGGASQNEVAGMTNTSWNGFRIIHGVDVISSQSVPYIQFAVKGSGTSETVSPKIYHSTTTAASPYNGGTWITNTDNIYWVEYIGNGSSTTKRFRAWQQPAAAASSSTRLPARRLIADWSGTITVGGSSDSSTYFGLIAGGSPTTPGGARECWITDFSVEIAPKFVTDYSQQDLNY